MSSSSSPKLPVGTIKATGLPSEQSRNGCFVKASALRLLSPLIPIFSTITLCHAADVLARFGATTRENMGVVYLKEVCGKLGGIMKRLRFLLFALLLALILALGAVAADSPRRLTVVDVVKTSDQGDSRVLFNDHETSDSAGSSQNMTSSNRHPSSSATITITWTTAVPPEE